MNDFDIMGAAASGMKAQRAAMDVETRNVALAQTGDVRHPAYGFIPQFANVLAASDADVSGPVAPDTAIEARMNEQGSSEGSAASDGSTADDDARGAVVAFAGVRPSSQPIDSIGEMVSVLDAQRAYEADASVFDVGKRLIQRTIEMGRL